MQASKQTRSASSPSLVTCNYLNIKILNITPNWLCAHFCRCVETSSELQSWIGRDKKGDHRCRKVFPISNLCPPPISSKAVSIKSPVLCRKLTFAQCNRPSDPFDLHVCPLPIGIQYDRPGMEAPCSLWHLLSTTVAIQGLMSTKTQVYSHREHSWRWFKARFIPLCERGWICAPVGILPGFKYKFSLA